MKETLLAILFLIGIIFVLLSLYINIGISYIGKFSMGSANIYLYRIGFSYYACMQKIKGSCLVTQNTLVCPTGSCIKVYNILNVSSTK